MGPTISKADVQDGGHDWCRMGPFDDFRKHFIFVEMFSHFILSLSDDITSWDPFGAITYKVIGKTFCLEIDHAW